MENGRSVWEVLLRAGEQESRRAGEQSASGATDESGECEWE